MVWFSRRVLGGGGGKVLRLGLISLKMLNNIGVVSLLLNVSGIGVLFGCFI